MVTHLFVYLFYLDFQLRTEFLWPFPLCVWLGGGRDVCVTRVLIVHTMHDAYGGIQTSLGVLFPLLLLWSLFFPFVLAFYSTSLRASIFPSAEDWEDAVCLFI